MKVQLRLLLTAICALALSFTGPARAETPSPIAGLRMKAIVYHDYGSPDVLRLEEIDKPVPNDDQVLIRVRAAAVNPLDWHFMRGEPYLVRFDRGLFAPKSMRLGVDVAGEVEAVGKSVTRFKAGDAVFGGRLGAFAEYVCANEDSLASKPAILTFEQAASVPIAGVTALQGLRDKGKIQPGQRVLINGASGGVGTFAVQIAKAFGAEVTGVCSTRNIEMVRSLGADHVIDYTREDFTKSGQQYDLILDMVGSHSMSDYSHALTPKGALVVVGNTDKGRWLGPMKGALKAVLFSRFVTQDMGMFISDVTRDDLTILGDLMQAGKVKPVIDRRFGLSEVPLAIRYIEEGHARGKVVIHLDDANGSPISARLPPSRPTAIESELILVALICISMGLPMAAALALNRRFSCQKQGKRSYRWGYYFGIQSFICGVCLGILLESGVGAVISCGVIYGLLGWFFALRRRWAWIALTILSFNPALWIVNFIYLRKRWSEDSVATRVAAASAASSA